MDQQVSPAVVIVVLILVVACVVALYFLWVQHPESGEGGGAGVRIDLMRPPVPKGEEAPAKKGAAEEESSAEGDTAEMSEDSEAAPPAGAEVGEVEVETVTEPAASP